MSTSTLPSMGDLAADDALAVHQRCMGFEDAWKDWQGGVRPVLEAWLVDGPARVRSVLLKELLWVDLEYRRSRAKERPALADYLGRFRGDEELLRRVMSGTVGNGSDPDLGPTSGPQTAPGRLEETGHCAPALASELPKSIGRHRVERVLGQGGFGRVYLAHDDQLRRPVAVKVPHARLVARAEDAEPYLLEARTVAGLEHPNIVVVYDVGGTSEFPVFVVSQYVEGSDLKHRLRLGRPSMLEAIEWTATVADTLHFAHGKGLVHRDIKPGNILLDKNGKPYVADFGLALREENVGKGPRFVGTPLYMSPEQARGEGHRVDGRSDIFSLGIVFYELLTGRRPFQADSRNELLEQITSRDVPPPRQWDDRIPKELERVCLQALARRTSDRYPTAKDMAEDLLHFLASPVAAQVLGRPDSTNRFQLATRTRQPISPPTGAIHSHTPLTTPSVLPSDSVPLRIVPKGLRSFDAHDADFFLHLLPGPRDREGLPTRVRFWKTRIEETDPDGTFAVGLIYGPSGCGKSSLVKAGLLPRLSEGVVVVYVEATSEETETRLVNGLRKRCPFLPSGLGLKETLVELRRSEGRPTREKVLIVLDQFEQWLHARQGQEDGELIQALRQCDGGRVQCIILVRDDFWLAVSRFMRELEVPLVEGQNSALADLFDCGHAKKVLAAFGLAYGNLPENGRTKEQTAFLDQAVAGLAEGGKVVCVRLALFAEMMRGKPWTLQSLKEVGGAEGVGATFLEETFSAATAPPEHRYHQKAARAVLKALLPESGSEIKGHMRSNAELRMASGYSSRPRDFESLLSILDGELRLLTPTDPEGKEADSDAAARPPSGQKYYQLTHDYLVHSLRDWLTRKQKETRRGRAEIRLAERAALWDSRQKNRHLPSWWEWANIRLFTRQRDWTPTERRLMRQAGRLHAVRGTLLAFVLALLGGGGLWTFAAQGARSRVQNLLTARTADVPEIVQDLDLYRPWADPQLRAKAAQEGLDEDKRLHVALALLPSDSGQANYLRDRLLKARGPEEVKAIRAVLHQHARDSAETFWPVLLDGGESRARRLRAACALSLFDSDNARWAEVGSEVARGLTGEGVLSMGEWATLLEPVRGHLVQPLVRGLVESDVGSFPTFVALLSAYPEEAVAELHMHLRRTGPPAASQEERLARARELAQIGVALLRLGRPDRVWPLFHQGEDPTVRTHLVHRCAALGVDPAILESRLLGGEEKDPSVRQGLLMALGEYNANQWAEVTRGPLVGYLLREYQDDPDPGVHSALEWLLGRWKMTGRLARIDREPTRPGAGLIPGKHEKARWYRNTQGQTFAVIPAPGRIEIGTPPGGKVWFEGEGRRQVHLDYSFAVGTRLVTVAEFRKCPELAYFRNPEKVSPGPDTPINAVSWYDAARYCNWLSAEEKIAKDQWCYEPNARGEYAEGMRVKANSRSLAGYRLPSEAEWEYACRAGTVTTWWHGMDEGMLTHHAWYSVNSGMRMHAVGTAKPNGLGLFDMHGNAWQWCQDVHGAQEAKGVEIVTNNDLRSQRGGSYSFPALMLRSVYRSGNRPRVQLDPSGFRMARTWR